MRPKISQNVEIYPKTVPNSTKNKINVDEIVIQIKLTMVN